MPNLLKIIKKFLDSAEKIEHYQDELKHQTQSLMIFQIGKAMASSMHDVEATHNLITDAVTMLLRVQRCILFLLDPSSGTLKARSARGMINSELLERFKLKLKDTIVHSIISRNSATVIGGDYKDKFIPRKLMDMFGVSSFLIAPLKVEERILGLIVADSKIDGSNFTEEDSKNITLFANFAAIAEENAFLIDRLKKEKERFQALFEIAKALNSTLEVDRLFELIIDKGMELTKASTGSLLLFDGQTNLLNIKTARGVPEKTVKTLKISMEEGITGWVAKSKKIANVKDVLKDPRYIPTIEEVRSELAVPMTYEDELLGVINVNHTDVAAFDEEDEKLLEAFAAAASIALKNVERFLIKN